MCAAKSHVRFTPNSRHVQRTTQCPLRAKSGLNPTTGTLLFDYSVGFRQNGWWNSQTKNFGTLEIDHKFQHRRLLNGQLHRLGAVKNAVNQVGDTTIRLHKARSISADSAALSHHRPARHHRDAPTHREV